MVSSSRRPPTASSPPPGVGPAPTTGAAAIGGIACQAAAVNLLQVVEPAIRVPIAIVSESESKPTARHTR